MHAFCCQMLFRGNWSSAVICMFLYLLLLLKIVEEEERKGKERRSERDREREVEVSHFDAVREGGKEER